jgi:hypothetical protein
MEDSNRKGDDENESCDVGTGIGEMSIRLIQF